MERPDGHVAVSVQHPWAAGAQLGQRDLDGDTDRPQGRHGGREGDGDDDPRLPDAAGARRGGVGLFPQRADERHQVPTAHPPAGPPGDRAEP